MKQATLISAAQAWCHQARKPLALVPTMGALHEGHATLIRHARNVVGPEGSVIVSLFVNPIQFGLHEDLSRYPRTLEADALLCAQAGVDFLFHPTAEEMYASDASVRIEERQLSETLCGKSRPGHFAGMATVVAKLFHITAPQYALFGEKDWQQLAIIRRFVRDLNFPVHIINCPTVREHDGLAISSRNAYLNAEERKSASKIYQALQKTATQAQEGEFNVSMLLAIARATLDSIPNARIEYVAIVDQNTLQPLEKIVTGTTPARLLVALKIGQTRLIDNISLVKIESPSHH